MADNVYNITLPDGTVVPLPAWARESTLQVLVDQLKIGGDISDKLIAEVKGLNVDTDQLEDALTKMFDNLEKVKREETSAETKSRMDFAKSIAKSTTDIVDSFSDTSKPLSNMHAALGKFGGAVEGGISNYFKDSEFLKGAGEMAESRWGQAANLIGDAAFAYAGFIAGQLENFAEAQSNMINAGAVFFDESINFDRLRDMAVRSGITYKQLSEISAQYGVTLQSLGQGVSGGVVAFTEQFQALNEFGNDFGDFGMSSEQMANAFIDYIDVQRMVGSINAETVQTTEQLQTGFAELMMETTALAALTGMNRDEMMAKQNAALRSPEVAAALIRLREAGFEDQAGAVEQIVRDLATYQDLIPEGVGGILQTAMSTMMTDAAQRGDFSSVNLREYINAADPGGQIGPLLQQLGITDKINTAIKSGMPAEDLRDMIVTEFAAAQDKLPDIAMNTGVSLSDYAATIKEFRDKSTILNEQAQTLLNASDEERAKIVADMQSQLDKSGTTTEALNTLTTQFLKAQAALTVDLNFMSKVSLGLANAMEKVTGFFESQPSEDGGDDGQIKPLEQIMDGGTPKSPNEVLDILEDLGIDPVGSLVVDDEGNAQAPLAYDADVIRQFQSLREHPVTGFPLSGAHLMLNQVFDTIIGDYVIQFPEWYMDGAIMMANPEARYSGGPVEPGKAYVVGESRPGGKGEIFVPQVPGQIVSNADAQAALGNMTQNFPQIEQLASALLMQSASRGDGLVQEHIMVTERFQQAMDSIIGSFGDDVVKKVQDELAITASSDPVNENLQGPKKKKSRPTIVDPVNQMPVDQEQGNVATAQTPLVENIQPLESPQMSSQDELTADMITRIEEEINNVAITKENLAATIRQYNQEFKRYRRLNEQGRTIA